MVSRAEILRPSLTNIRCRPRPNAGRISIFRDGAICPPLHFTGSAFRNEVWEPLCGIPYGSTTTYGELAARLAQARPARRRGWRRRGLPICPRRRWAARWKTGFRSSSPPPRRRRERKPDGLRGGIERKSGF
ncbi:MAG: MGMT family protein [Acutalibacteraceae bacterium]